jgi:hypothetical protein
LAYVHKNFSRDKHEMFFTSKVRFIQATFGKVAWEMEKMASHVDRVEGKLLRELERRLAAIEDRVVERVRWENREVLEGVRSEVSQLQALLENREERLETVVKGQGRKTRGLLLGECRKVIEGGEKVVEQVGEVRRELASKGAPVGHNGERGSWAEVTRRRRKKKVWGSMVVAHAPKEGETGKDREELGDLLGKKQWEVRVRAIRRQGRDFVLEVNDSSDVDKLKGLGLEGFRVNGGLRLRTPE